ncbi:MAG TPA: SpoIIE family protein phosphatase [Chloroflexia bacterium]|nr:SpoIIE family protein phosphatase [Chloroflexia bacterium]
MQQQLESSIGATNGLPPAWQRFLDAVDVAYRHTDEERARFERELDDLRQTERMLHYSEEKTLALLENIDAYFEVDLTGHLTYVNGPFCEAVQYSREEVLGRHYRHYNDRRFIRKVFEAFNTVYRTGEPQQGVIFSILRRNGDTGYADANVSLMRDVDGNPIGFRGILRDVTESLRMGAELRKAKEAAEGELEIGRQIQAGFLPEHLPQPQGWEINGHFRPAREVAGDFYDAFLLGRGSMMGIVIADVCGKGVGAALFMALVRSLVRAYANQHFSTANIEMIARGQARAATTLAHRKTLAAQGVMPATSVVLKDSVLHTITETNDYIATNHGKANMFATLFLGVLDHASGLLTYVNGGHEAPVVTAGGEIKARLEPTGPAVGMLPDMKFEANQVYLEPGDTLVMYTDGVLDARNPQGAFFGESQLLSLLSLPAESTDSLLQALDSSLRSHIAGASQFDDITMLAVRRTSEFEWERNSAGATATDSDLLKLEISREATVENLPVLRQFVEEACLQAGISEDVTFAFKLAVDEVCTNIVTHGYAGLTPGPIEVTFRKNAQQAAITITDRGHPFDPDQAARPDLEASWEDRQIGGLGLYFVHELMDRVSYWSDPTKGNHLTMVKRLDEAGPSQEA